MKYQLVIQWSASTVRDFDRMVEVEDAIEQALPPGSVVDGHDAGSGEVNIFIHTDEPDRVFEMLKATLADSDALDTARVAFREQTGSEYTTLWPEGLEGFKVT